MIHGGAVLLPLPIGNFEALVGFEVLFFLMQACFTRPGH